MRRGAGRNTAAGVHVAADDPPRLEGGPFHMVVCQLVISIIGTIRQRANLLRHVHDVLYATCRSPR